MKTHYLNLKEHLTHHAQFAARFTTLLAILLALLFTLSACSTGDSDNGTGSNTSEAEIFESKLSSLPNVLSVEKLNIESTFKGSLYKVYFSSLLDPSDPTKGTFKQKAFIGFAGFDKPNCLTTAGYMLSDPFLMRQNSENECAFILNGNLVAVEHRYFGESVRTDKKRSDGNYDGTYWEYLSTKNASEDLHAIVTSLKPILKGKWVAQGASKGGLTANIFCYHHPEDVDLTMPYVAPLCNEKHDSRFFDFIFNTIGDNDDRYKNDAADYRQLFKDVQIWLLERRDAIYENGVTYKQKIFNESDPAGGTSYYNKDYLTPDIHYDICVSDFPVGNWMYGNDKNFDLIKKYYELPDDNSNLGEGTPTKKEYFCSIFINTTPPDMDISPYYIQAYTELGNYKPGLSQLRQTVNEAKAAGKDVELFVEESKQDTIYEDCLCSDAERALFENYNDSLYQNLSEWINTTDEKIIMLYGNSDPWYSVRINDVQRDNVHIFVHPANNHYTSIDNFPEPQKSEIIDLIRKYMM